MNKFLLFLSPFAIAAAVLLGTAAPAFAASAFDSNYITTDVLVVDDTYTGQPDTSSFDVTSTYQQIFSGPGEFLDYPVQYVNNDGSGTCSLGVPCGTVAAMLAFMHPSDATKQSWFISDYGEGLSTGGVGSGGVMFCYSFESSSLQWGGTYVRAIATNPWFCFYLSFTSDSRNGGSFYDHFRVTALSPQSTPTLSNNYLPPSAIVSNYYANITDFNYPVGYEGAPIRTEAPIPPQPFEWADATPKWVILRLINFELQFHDANFLTVDNIPFVCDDQGGVAPLIRVSLYDTDGLPVFENELFGASSLFDFTLPDTGEAERYTLTGMYSCTADFDDFTSFGTIMFQVDQNGNQYYNLLEECFTSDFPFIDFKGCTENFSAALSLIGFRFNNPFENQFGEVPLGECHTMSVLHTWLPLDNPVICKQFPSYVRNTVTPFISFAVGLMTMRFIAQRRRDDL